MNLIQKIIGSILPPYRNYAEKQDQELIYRAIINSLPTEFEFLKFQCNNSNFMGLKDWAQHPGYKFVTNAFPGDTLFHFQKRGENFKIAGIKVFSKSTRSYQNVELLICNNLVAGLRIENSNYTLGELDLRIDGSKAHKESFVFPPTESEKFYLQLNPELKNVLNLDQLEEVELNSRTFFLFYDMEDSNGLATDKNQIVYSLVHDARPVAKKMQESLPEILLKIKEGQFDKEKHMDERYRSTK